MAIVQISKIIHRTGANVDLPQLDIGEIGFATDEQRVFIGNDPEIVPPVAVGATTQTEILTQASSLDFSRLNGSSNATLELADVATGQLLGINVTGDVTKVINVGGNVGGQITLGNISDVKATGGVNGFVLQTDGTGNLSWTTNGTLAYKIQGFSEAYSGNLVVTTSTPHYFGTGTLVTISDVLPTGTIKNYIDSAGVGGTNQYYTYRRSSTTFTIHDDAAYSVVAYESYLSGYTANSATIVGQISPTGNAVPGGANTQVQFQDTSGAFGGDANLTFNKSTSVLAVTGNVNATYFNGSFRGPLNGVIGATTANVATFSSVTINNTLSVTGNVTANNVIAGSNGSGTNYKVGDDAYIGDINISNTIRIKGVEDSANAYIVFGTGDTSALGRAGTGPLTYEGDFEADNVTTGNVNLNTWSIFGNVDGLYATDGVDTYPITLGPAV
jgi:hypothetical protein